MNFIYGLRGMFGKVDVSTRTCNQCAREIPTSDLFSCTACDENTSTADHAKPFFCGTCIAKKHKGHDYRDVQAKNNVEQALQQKSAQVCQEAAPEANAWVRIGEDPVANVTVEAFATAGDGVPLRVVELSTNDIFGFRIKGGKEVNSPIFVSGICPGRVADRPGGLRRGDQLIAINGVNVEHVSHDRAVHLMMRAMGNVKLLVRYTPKLLDMQWKLLDESEWKLLDKMKRRSDEQSPPSA